MDVKTEICARGLVTKGNWRGWCNAVKILSFFCLADWMREETCCGYDKKMILFSTLLFVLLLKTESKTPEAGKKRPYSFHKRSKIA